VGADGAWWLPQSSKLVRPDIVGLGGFDSHTFPPRGGARVRSLLAALLLAAAIAPAARAQRADSARIGASAAPVSDSLPTALQPASPKPPITPTRALVQSLLIPGWGQSSLDRGTAGAIFVGVEVISVAMLIQSKAQLKAAQRVAWDTAFPPNYPNEPAQANPLQQTLGSRQQAVEDWTVLIIFNHLLSAADAFVAAHLWNVPIEIQGSPTNKQATVRAHLNW